jgi:PAS domain S-box-containing protein
VHFQLIEEMQQERELMRALMENSPDMIFFKDCELRFTRVSRSQAESMAARDPAECIGKSDADYFEVDDARRWRAEEQEILRSGRAQIDQVEQFKRPQDGVCWLSTTKVPMFDRSGRVSGIAGIARDITALKNSEEMLREEAERNLMDGRGSDRAHALRHSSCSHISLRARSRRRAVPDQRAWILFKTADRFSRLASRWP